MSVIQWFPGHMAKARRQVEEKLNLIDIVFVLLDARAPKASQNPMLYDIIKHKPMLYILNKADLADQNCLSSWIAYFEKQAIPAIAMNSLEGNATKEIVSKAKKILKPLFDKEASKGLKSRPFRAMVLGIPNVGKSAFINRLANRVVASTGDKPGVTKAQKYIRVESDFELMDNPGILWPKFEDPDVAYKLALLGSIKDDTLPMDDVVLYGLNYLNKVYPGRIEERYHIEKVNPDHFVETLDAIAHQRKAYLPGKEIDYERVMNGFLYDLRHNKLGPICLESAD